MNRTVSILEPITNWLISGVVSLSHDHPFVACAVLAMLAGAAYAVLLDVFTNRSSVFLLLNENRKVMPSETEA